MTRLRSEKSLSQGSVVKMSDVDEEEDRSECEDRLSMNRDRSKDRPLKFSDEPESSDKKEKKRSDVCEEQPERSRNRAAPRYRRIEQGQGEIPEEPHNGRRHMQSRGRRSSKRSSDLPVGGRTGRRP